MLKRIPYLVVMALACGVASAVTARIRLERPDGTTARIETPMNLTPRAFTPSSLAALHTMKTYNDEMLVPLTEYTDHGGRLTYLDGNGFYWVTTRFPGHCSPGEFGFCEATPGATEPRSVPRPRPAHARPRRRPRWKRGRRPPRRSPRGCPAGRPGRSNRPSPAPRRRSCPRVPDR
jgi:hypothetical protein